MPSLSQKIPLPTALTTGLSKTIAVTSPSSPTPVPASSPSTQQHIAPVTAPQTTSTTTLPKKSKGLYITQN
jgi:hypothetical protein